MNIIFLEDFSKHYKRYSLKPSRSSILIVPLKSGPMSIKIVADPTYGENLIARCSQVHDNFTMGVNRKILINLIYLFIQETYLTCANRL